MNSESKHYVQTISRISRERNEALSKLLLNEQIAEETQSFHKEIVNQLEEKILELRRIIHDKEYAIQEIEKIKAIPEKDGLLLRVKEIIAPNQQSLKLNQEMESLKEIISKMADENHKLVDHNLFLQEVNRNLRREIIKIRLVVSNPVNFQRMKGFLFDI